MHSCTKFSILVLLPVNSVGQLMLYSFLGAMFSVASSVKVINGFMVVEAIYFQSWICHSVLFWSSSVMLAKCVSWIACSFVMPLNILRYNQEYKVLVQSSSIQKSSLVLWRVYLKNRADVTSSKEYSTLWQSSSKVFITVSSEVERL